MSLSQANTAAAVPAPKCTVLCMIGTRPEAIKMAPVIAAIAASDWARPVVVSSGQHTSLLTQAMADFGVQPDHELTVARKSGSILEILTQVIEKLDGLVTAVAPDFIVAQGDTTTVAAASIVSFHRHIPFVHVEAGLRTGDLAAPFPEEYNRRLVALATRLHCCPTTEAADNLRREGIAESEIIVTGNTVIDALLQVADTAPTAPVLPAVKRLILLTAHRRENFGASLDRALGALRDAVDRHADLGIVFPVHPNPETRKAAQRIFADHPRIVLCDPLNYHQMVATMQASWLIVTDSGGLQEEGPALGRPVLVLRDVTERPEAVEAGAVRLVGTDPAMIGAAIDSLCSDTSLYAAMAKPVFPYGDGHAAGRIVSAMQAMAACSTSAAS